MRGIAFVNPSKQIADGAPLSRDNARWFCGITQTQYQRKSVIRHFKSNNSNQEVDQISNLPTTSETSIKNRHEEFPANSYPGPLDVARPAHIPWEDIILFQAFGWDSCKTKDGNWYAVIQNHIDDILQAHVTHLWLPPPSKSVSKEGYLPSDLYNLFTFYGDYKSLTELNAALLSSNIFPLADIVVNHRCADKQDSDGIWNHFTDDIPHPGHRIDWGPDAITSNDPDYRGRGKLDSGEDFGPSPDLDHSNEDVQLGLIDWMRWLHDYVGFEGFRFDFAKGYAAEYSKLYVQESLDAGKDFCVAEYWVDAAWSDGHLEYNQDAMRQQLCDWMDAAKYCSTFDFPTKALLQEAIKHCQYDRLKDKNNKPPGLLGWWPSHAVTFIDNHDTGSSQQHWPFPKNGVLQGYAYILTHPGIPCIFWEHYFDWKLKNEIIKLVELRKRAGICATSLIDILCAESDMYVAKINGSVIIKMGPRYDMGHVLPSKEDGWSMVLSGDDWAVWELIKN